MAKGIGYHPLPCSKTIGVPQGGVLSGLLSNLYTIPFDSTMLDKRHNLVRYADDFVVACSSASERDRALIDAKNAAKDIKQELHPGKTISALADQGVDFVGFHLKSRRVSVRSWNVDKFKSRIQEVLEMDKYKPTSPHHIIVRKRLVYHLNTKITGVTSEDGLRRSWMVFFRIVNDIEQLQRLNRWIWQEFSRWNKLHYGNLLSHSEIRKLGLRSLTTEYRRVRREIPTYRLSSS